MINSAKRDVQYTFGDSLRSFHHSELIDDQWRADRLVDLDIVLPNNKAFQTKMT
jgi:hypothetical protein